MDICSHRPAAMPTPSVENESNCVCSPTALGRTIRTITFGQVLREKYSKVNCVPRCGDGPLSKTLMIVLWTGGRTNSTSWSATWMVAFVVILEPAMQIIKWITCGRVFVVNAKQSFTRIRNVNNQSVHLSLLLTTTVFPSQMWRNPVVTSTQFSVSELGEQMQNRNAFLPWLGIEHKTFRSAVKHLNR